VFRLCIIQATTFVFCIFDSPQNRHPERSASQIYRVTQCLMARSRRTPRVLTLPMPLGAFQPPKPAPGGPTTVFDWGRDKNCWHLAMAGGYIYILGSHKARFTLASPATCICASCNIRRAGLRWLKRSEQHGQDKTFGVLRLRATKRCVTR
jgi:hypothetical protein